GGIKTVLIPEENAKDLTEIPKNIKEKLDIRPVRWVDEVLEVALERSPEPLADKSKGAKKKEATKEAGEGNSSPLVRH
ncbi:MAG: hypothetical protein LJE84_13040, partial [Gammaproteobacteria bacterium]|nr:hypothetical protein [Gammaproteobacteria bacterium]